MRAASLTPARATSPTPASVPTISVAVAAPPAAPAAKTTATAAAPSATPGPSTADLSQTIADSLARYTHRLAQTMEYGLQSTHRLAQTVEEGFQKLSSQTCAPTTSAAPAGGAPDDDNPTAPTPAPPIANALALAEQHAPTPAKRDRRAALHTQVAQWGVRFDGSGDPRTFLRDLEDKADMSNVRERCEG
ncbi:testis-specific gene A8 protein-like [Scaptodrosophila lebanonensis]|uniref:Testis-specific gene A8 protein-like n=1 Tax=Drosophila lebanonensis TaxID=7225 RepID=A0A6J2TWW2_DROLE|nr:testis-specific gene A8 protein-like [Scaptodrosophila lebanonensis]